MKKEALLALAVLGLSTSPSFASDAKEKCYGVVKKGMNECGNKTHGCHAGATVDAGADEFITLNEGLCKQLGDTPKANCLKHSSDKKVCESLVESKKATAPTKKM